MKKLSLKDSPLSYLKIFLLLVVLVVIASLFYKGIKLYQESTFKSYSYALLVLSKNAFIVQVDRNKNSLSILTIKDGAEHIHGKSRLTSSILTSVPIDGIVEYKNAQEFQDFKNEFFSLQNSLNVGTNLFFHKLVNLNVIDLLSMQTFTAGVPDENIQEESVGNKSSDWDGKTQERIFQMFKDPLLINDNVSVEILNAAGVDGLGGKVGAMLENLGINVVSIHSEVPQSKSSIVYHNRESETLRRVMRIFSLTPELKNGTDIADITIRIGKDIGKSLSDAL